MDKRYRKKSCLMLCIFIAVLLSLLPVNSFPIKVQRLKFESFTIDDGLSQGTIFCILQDRQGFLWLGTEGGLNRYDGYEFKVFEPDKKNVGNISGSEIRAICQDKHGVLWVGTNKGLDRFERSTETFGHFPNNKVTAIFEDKYSTLWIGTAKEGLKKFDRLNNVIVPINNNHINKNNTDIPKAIAVIYEDSQDVLWIGASDGLYRFDRDRNTFFKAREIPKNEFVRAIHEDRSGRLWVGSYGGGLNRYIRKTDSFEKIPPCSPGSTDGMSDDSIMAIFEEDDLNVLWIGTYNGGLNRFDPENKTFLHYKRERGILTSLSDNHVYSIHKDRSGLIWIGTESGLNKLDERKNVFRHWEDEPYNRDSLEGEAVWAFLEDQPGIIWIGTDTALNRFDKRTGKFKNYKYNPMDQRSISKGKVQIIYKDSNNDLWVGTALGLNKFDRKSETFARFLPKKWIYELYEDRSGNFWAITGESLYLKKKNKTKFEIKEKEGDGPFSLKPGGANCIKEDRWEILWIGTKHEGLHSYNLNNRRFLSYRHDPNDPNSISDDNIQALYPDSSGTLWIGTYQGGLSRFERENGTFKRIKNIPGYTINSILEDDSGNLWISTVKGLVKYTPGTGKITTYDTRDGLHSNEFNARACLKSKDGMLFFGSTHGFNAFYPGELIHNSHRPKIVITGFKVYNKPQPMTSIIEKSEIRLSYNQSVFSFEFAALDFSAPGKNKYEYIMEGVDPDPVVTDAKRRFVTYTNVTHGTHKFKVKGSNNHNHWSDEELSITVIISPPYWKTWWFRTILGFLALTSLVGGYLLRTHNLREKIAEQERVQKVLRHSRDEMERARDLAEIRSAENEKLITAISALFIAVDSNGAVFQLNKPAAEFFGIPRKDALNNLFIDVFRDCIKAEKLDEIIEKGLDPERASKEIEFSVDLKSRGKGIKLLLASVSTIMDRSGKKLGFLLLAEDITNRKEEEMLKNLSKKLESVGQMASGIAHEIKTPLQYIGHNARFVADSFSHMVKYYETVFQHLPELETAGQNEIADKLKHLANQYDLEYIMDEIPVASEQMIDGVERVADIISAMNEFSHPGKGFKEKTDINRLLKTTLVMVQNRIKKNAEVRFKLYNELPHIPCYPAELNQVFLNILVNALDAIMESKQPGLITLTSAIDEKDVVISISDTGCGIPVENIDHIFNPFFTTKEVGKGTGQGLSLVHNVIVERHGGKLDLASKKDIGTTFNIRLPIEGEN